MASMASAILKVIFCYFDFKYVLSLTGYVRYWSWWLQWEHLKAFKKKRSAWKRPEFCQSSDFRKPARLQESIDNRVPLPYEDEDTYDPEDSLEDSASYVDVESDIAHLTSTGDASSSRTDGESDVLLEYDRHLDIESDTKGPKISERVATVVNKLCLKRISQEQSKVLMKRHNTTENIQVCLPKCEQSIWNQLEGHIVLRVNDVKLQGTQSLLLSSINCQLKVSKALLNLKADKETMTTCLDGLTLAMTANYEFNQRRRDAIKPQFRPEFAKGLCTSTAPADEFLFRGDTSKRVKEISELSKSRLCKSQAPRGKGKRYSPYPSRNYRADTARGRGRTYRGRSSQ